MIKVFDSEYNRIGEKRSRLYSFVGGWTQEAKMQALKDINAEKKKAVKEKELKQFRRGSHYKAEDERENDMLHKELNDAIKAGFKLVSIFEL